VALGLVVGVVGQVGDLVESLLKRGSNVKTRRRSCQGTADFWTDSTASY
jgi:CDP-diglyceride synthetase